MKKTFTILSLLISLSRASLAQTPVVCEDFNTYDATTAAANYHGWALTYFTANSFYTTIPSSGAVSGPNSYKFGVDSATAITPDLTGADNISFWMKGNPSSGGSLANGAFYIYESSDSISFTQMDVITPIPGFVAMYKHYALTAGTKFVKFFYDKDSGNVAFDDFCATLGPTTVGMNEVAANVLSAFPNPTKGMLNVNLNESQISNAVVTVHNVLGMEIKRVTSNGYQSHLQVDLSDFPNGVYYIKLKSDAGETSQRVIVRK